MTKTMCLTIECPRPPHKLYHTEATYKGDLMFTLLGSENVQSLVLESMERARNLGFTHVRYGVPWKRSSKKDIVKL